MARIILRGRNYFLFIGGLVGFIGLACYPIIVHPMLYPEKYKKIQQSNRGSIRQEEIQPGNMRVWSDPFKPRQDRPS
ncbi:small integral membrane protein 20-like [Toxorhynchites rutilus septentrionalis]|uniref:small integral membrane protein 20-like n=1 Tax=Toxorhynchites rutilus septentrionalis TaxID=329112 RepID=UPI0024786CD7|nr:small integral membrane protein 20-like [Toxorhynchites rutilus septentrionalis]